MQNLIINGNLHCTKHECAKLAAIQLRIIVLAYLKKLQEEEKDKAEKLLTENETEKLKTIEESVQKSIQGENQSIIELSREIVKIKSEQEKLEDLKHKHDLISNINNNPIKTDTIREETEDDKEESKLLCAHEFELESTRQENMERMLVIILTNGRCESLKLYLESCSCLSKQKTAKTLELKNLVHPNYKRSRDIIKLIEAEKELLSKESFYNNEMKLKEFYVETCSSLNCFDSKLYEVKEVIYNEQSSSEPFKLVKRHLAIKPNRISLIDYKTKELVKTEQMTDLKSWFSGENYYDLTPFFFQNSSGRRRHESTSSSLDGTMASILKQQSDLLNSSRLRKFANLFNKNKINPDKNFLIHFRNMKWQLQIDDDDSLKSITCILLDQSLDIGIDSNPLMLDLTITDHFQNRYKLFSSTSSQQQNMRNSTVYFLNHHQSQISNFYPKKRLTNTVATPRTSEKKSVFSSNSQKSRNDHSPSLSNAANQHPETHSENVNSIINTNSVGINEDRSKANKAISNQPISTNPVSHYESNNGLACVNSTTNINSTNTNAFYLTSNMKPAKYEAEFQELQLVLLWFPEEVAFRLTEVEYELFKQVHPSEYLRYASLDINNVKSAMLAESSNKSLLENSQVTTDPQSSPKSTTKSKSLKLNNVSTKSVEDLLVRYKEVNLFIYSAAKASDPSGFEKKIFVCDLLANKI